MRFRPLGSSTAYRSGSILFTGVTGLRWDDQGWAPGVVDASGELDYGSIDTFAHDGDLYTLTGDFGRIEVATRGLPGVVLQ